MKAVESLPDIHRAANVSNFGHPHSAPSQSNDAMYKSVSLPTLARATSASSGTGVRSHDGGQLVFESSEWNSNTEHIVTTADRDLPPTAAVGTDGFNLEWQRQRLVSEGVERSKVGWENEIARHILSLYASTHAAKHDAAAHIEARQLLDFVGEKQQRKGSPKRTGRAEEEEEGLVYAVPQFHQNYDAHVQRPVEDGKHGHTRHHRRHIYSMEQEEEESREIQSTFALSTDKEDEEQEEAEEEERDGDQQQLSTSQEATKKKPKKKNKRKKKKQAGVSDQREKEREHFVQSFLQRLQAEQTALRRAAETGESQQTLNPQYATSADVTELIMRHPYRTVNTIKMRRLPKRKHETPTEITVTVQGSPKVASIWFTSTAEIFCDWSLLPGGRKLTAHLAVLYESGDFETYVQLLSLLILKLARRVQHGAEEFSAGTFGLSERYGDVQIPGNTKQRSKGNSHTDKTSTKEVQWFDHIVQRTMSSPQRRAARSRYEAEMNEAEGQGEGGSRQSSPSRRNRREEKLRFPGDPDYQSADAETPLLSLSDLQVLWERLLHATLALGLRCWERGQSAANDLRHRQKLQQRLLQQQQQQEFLQRTASGGSNKRASPAFSSAAFSLLKGPKQRPEDDPSVRRWYDRGMQLLSLCDRWLRDHDDLVVGGKKRRKYFYGLVQDAMAGYFYVQQRALAARAFCSAALQCFEEIDDPVLEAQALLHAAAVETQLSNFKEAHSMLYQMLAMVETGRFGNVEADPKRLCLVAVCYHNLAVVQLKLEAPDLACKSSQNARRLARLCLAYSNRYLGSFQHTHRVALYDLQVALQQTSVDKMTPTQVQMVYHLAEALFAPEVVLEGENKEAEGAQT